MYRTVQTPIHCIFPKPKAAPSLAGWVSAMPQATASMPIKTFALCSVKIFLKKGTALRATHGFLKLNGTLISVVLCAKEDSGQKNSPSAYKLQTLSLRNGLE